MNCIPIAQAVLDKSLKVTILDQHKNLVDVFMKAGIKISDANKVLTATESALEGLVGSLGSSFPVAAIASKRALASHGITV